MTPNDFRIIACSMAISLIAGIGILLYGIQDRELPPKVDLIWVAADRIREDLQKGTLEIQEGESRESSYGQYRMTIKKLAKNGEETPVLEKYVLKIQSTYSLISGVRWKPATWVLGLVAAGENADRRVYLVAARRLKE